ncbi:Molybdenum cofactor biosynthesis protein MoaD [Methanosarcina sp. MTP4]|uniref:MoaD/ThiS family protein n=1 Tax=Methanosarcina sp. MTP4 TaxID=1434100 RepID=UPI000615E48B|nr:MoaD/ThiS family protein [Methanosarcina sp. MTP4]AKB25403.1 Molybdenum cofactor biosynthesis protein MoaD [Methanosarcina sp. MTP4]
MIMKVKFLDSVQEITEQPEIEVKIRKGDTVCTVLWALAYHYGHDFYAVTVGDESEYPKIRVLLNGRDIEEYSSCLEADVKSGDILELRERN